MKTKSTKAKAVVIGRTASGLDIYDRAKHPAHKAFTYMDHFDARIAHRDKMRELDKQRDHEGYLNNPAQMNQFTEHWLQYDEHQRTGKKLMKKIFSDN